MNTPDRVVKLEDVLDAFVASDCDPNETLHEWILRYPEYEQELTDFAVSWSLMKSMPTAPDAEEVDEDILVLRGMSIVQNLLHNQSKRSVSGSDVPFESLIDEGGEHGLEIRQFAQLAELGVILLRKLDRRLIHYPSIPQDAIKNLANAIKREASSVAAYLQRNPTFATATEHRSEQAPVLNAPEDFFDAVRDDPTILREHAARWLELEQSMDKT